MTIEITGLFQDPTRRYGPLSQARLKHVLADRFDVYLRTGQLKITIKTGKGESDVSPVQLDLPEIGAKFQEMHLPGEPDKVFRTRFWFDPSGQGRVAMRHTGVVIIDDIRELFEHEMTDSILVSGLIKGFVDAEFLSPLPARAQFFEDEYLTMLLDALQEIGVELDKEITGFRDEAENERMQTLFRRATRLAREISSARTSSWTLSSSMACAGSAVPTASPTRRTEIPSRSRPPTETRPMVTRRTAATGTGAGLLGTSYAAPTSMGTSDTAAASTKALLRSTSTARTSWPYPAFPAPTRSPTSPCCLARRSSPTTTQAVPATRLWRRWPLTGLACCQRYGNRSLDGVAPLPGEKNSCGWPGQPQLFLFHALLVAFGLGEA